MRSVTTHQAIGIDTVCALFRKVFAQTMCFPEFPELRMAIDLQRFVLKDIAEYDGWVANRLPP